MRRLSGRLSSLTVAHAREPGMLADGDGLYLQVTSTNAQLMDLPLFRAAANRAKWDWAP